MYSFGHTDWIHWADHCHLMPPQSEIFNYGYNTAMLASCNGNLRCFNLFYETSSLLCKKHDSPCPRYEDIHTLTAKQHRVTTFRVGVSMYSIKNRETFHFRAANPKSTIQGNYLKGVTISQK